MAVAIGEPDRSVLEGLLPHAGRDEALQLDGGARNYLPHSQVNIWPNHRRDTLPPSHPVDLLICVTVKRFG